MLFNPTTDPTWTCVKSDERTPYEFTGEQVEEAATVVRRAKVQQDIGSGALVDGGGVMTWPTTVDVRRVIKAGSTAG